MRYKRIVLIIAMLGLTNMAFSLPVDRKTLVETAQTFWKQHGRTDVVLTDISDKLPYSHLRVFASPNGGFVILSADDVARPVLGYSTEGMFPSAEMPQALQAWLNGYELEIGRAVELGYPKDADWGNGGTKDGGFTPVGPLLGTQWDQGDPFNAYCPGHCPVGCAATMQAQIMKYWNFPAFGRGYHQYNSQSYGMQSADFGHTLYQWDLMPNIGNFSATQAQRHALSTLLYQIGVSIDMNYNPSGSGAQGFAGWGGAISNDNSLINFFLYKNTLEVKDRANYTDTEFRDIMIEELSHLRPIAVQGQDSYVGGHAFVCDGNDSLGFLHFNFGWTGTGDGYYAIGAINPGIGSQGQLGDYRFNLDNKIIIKIEPDYAMRVSDTVLSLDQTAGTDSVIYCINDLNDEPWSVSVDQPWVTVSNTDFQRAGWVHFSYEENTSGSERVAVASFVQGSQMLEVRLVQSYIDSSNMCPVTVVMESTRGNGWQGGAYLSLESVSGYVFGTASLANGSSGTATIMVPDDRFVSVWHSGGGTDRNINYSIVNQYGEVILDVDYAYSNGGTHTHGSPCNHVSINAEPDGHDCKVSVYPNPSNDYVDVESTIPVNMLTVSDLNGRRILIDDEHQKNTLFRIDIRKWPAGVYLLQVVTDEGISTRRIVKSSH